MGTIETCYDEKQCKGCPRVELWKRELKLTEWKAKSSFNATCRELGCTPNFHQAKALAEKASIS